MGEDGAHRGGVANINFFKVIAGVVGDRGEVFVSTDGGAWQVPDRPRLFNWRARVAQAGEAGTSAVGERGLILTSRAGGAPSRQVAGAAPPPRHGSTRHCAAPAGHAAPLGAFPGREASHFVRG